MKLYLSVKPQNRGLFYFKLFYYHIFLLLFKLWGQMERVIIYWCIRKLWNRSIFQLKFILPKRCMMRLHSVPFHFYRLHCALKTWLNHLYLYYLLFSIYPLACTIFFFFFLPLTHLFFSSFLAIFYFILFKVFIFVLLFSPFHAVNSNFIAVSPLGVHMRIIGVRLANKTTLFMYIFNDKYHLSYLELVSNDFLKLIHPSILTLYLHIATILLFYKYIFFFTSFLFRLTFFNIQKNKIFFFF